MEKLISTIEYIKHLITEKSFQPKHKTSRSAFTKECKITFESVMLYVLGRTNTVLDFEILNFCEKRSIESFSNGAMAAARKKVNFEAFRSILQTLSYLLRLIIYSKVIS